MATVSLRRTKEQNLIQLPPKSVHTYHVDLLHEERVLYDRMEEEAKQVVKKYINDGSVTHNFSTVLSIILRLRQICTDVALCPHDIKSLLPPDNVQGWHSPYALTWMYILSSAYILFGELFACLVSSFIR